MTCSLSFSRALSRLNSIYLHHWLRCRTFYEQECSTLWLSVDGLAGNWSDKGEHTSPAPAGISGDYDTK